MWCVNSNQRTGLDGLVSIDRLAEDKSFDVQPAADVLGHSPRSFADGVSEEAGFRGYMQGPLMRRYGPVVAVLVVSVVFWVAHFNHPSGIARGRVRHSRRCCARMSCKCRSSGRAFK